jgi:hypothetical protein
LLRVLRRSARRRKPADTAHLKGGILLTRLI